MVVEVSDVAGFAELLWLGLGKLVGEGGEGEDQCGEAEGQEEIFGHGSLMIEFI